MIKTKYLGLIIGTKNIKMYSAKVETIQNWSTPICVKDVQGFMDFCNFYQRTVKRFNLPFAFEQCFVKTEFLDYVNISVLF